MWPLALGMVNNAVLQFTDRMFLAHDSVEALEAVLPASALAWIFMSFFQSVVGYSNVFVARYYGAGETDKCRTCYHAAMCIAVVSGLLMLPLWPFGDWLLSLFSPSESVGTLQRQYYDIVILGGFAIYGQMAAASYFTGQGRTRLVFWVNLAGNLVNVALDPILIFGYFGFPQMGIAGAAYATVFAMIVQMVVLIWAAHRDRVKMEWSSTDSIIRSFDHSIIFSILRFVVPAGAYTVLNMLSFTIFVFFTGRIGSIELAVSNACFTVNYLLIAPMEGFALGAATLVGQALGRKDVPEAFRAGNRTMVLGVVFVAVLSAVVIVLYRPILSVFASRVGAGDVAPFYSLGFTLFILMAAWQVFDAADIVILGALKGAGDTRFVMGMMFVVSFVIWIPLVWLVSVFHNTMVALWGTIVVDVVILCAGSMIRWYGGFWKRIKMI